ncbi:hypothetical protein BCR44DRAFT_1426584 [Catenaria anguillulae PL171]|uniref:Pre-mRNA-splicing factor 38 n=1 Tax=Catenaria anguillulae PL171 TaxID=765915 RepID=A0A1Y2HXV6_9FUNG|nr:hypothetical protein BCR44DRAFT_1426584 [Catenaria anguillulae PL171]
MYVRLTFPPRDVYDELEPLLNDARKLRVRMPGAGGYAIMYMDELLPRLQKRWVLEEAGELDGPRVSLLQDEFDASVEAEEEEEEERERREHHASDAMDVDDRPAQDEESDGSHETHGRRSGLDNEPAAMDVDRDVDVDKKVKVSKKKVAKLFRSSGKSSSSSGGDSGGFKESMTIEETNAMRIKLGLKPLKS